MKIDFVPIVNLKNDGATSSLLMLDDLFILLGNLINKLK